MRSIRLPKPLTDKSLAKEKPGSRWSLTARNPRIAHGILSVAGEPGDNLVFDELWLSRPYIHVEQMSKRMWFIAVGDYKLWATVNKDGTTSVSIETPGFPGLKGLHETSRD
jgi:hypothetical protein